MIGFDRDDITRRAGAEARDDDGAVCGADHLSQSGTTRGSDREIGVIRKAHAVAVGADAVVAIVGDEQRGGAGVPEDAVGIAIDRERRLRRCFDVGAGVGGRRRERSVIEDLEEVRIPFFGDDDPVAMFVIGLELVEPRT